MPPSLLLFFCGFAVYLGAIQTLGQAGRAARSDLMARPFLASLPLAPHEVLDPRDLKYCRNMCTADWLTSDDPFAWRERLPFARWGLAELQLMGWPLLALAVAGGWYHWSLAIVPGVLLAFVLYFFRDPRRVVPSEPGIRYIVHHQPIGTVAAFSPWNFPMSQPARKVAGALASGCSIIIKAAEETPAGSAGQLRTRGVVRGGTSPRRPRDSATTSARSTRRRSPPERRHVRPR